MSPRISSTPSSTPATWSAMEPAAPDVQRRSKLALTRLARHEDGDVTDGDARAGGDAFPRGQLDRAAVAGAGEPTDLGDPDHPPVGLARDVDLEALTDGREVHPTSDAVDTAVAHRLCASQCGL